MHCHCIIAYSNCMGVLCLLKVLGQRSLSKQYWPWLDSTRYDIWSEFTLFVTIVTWTASKWTCSYFSTSIITSSGVPLLGANIVINVKDQGPVVQSIVSLTSSLRVISLAVLADSMYNSILIFFAEKMWVAFALQKLLTFFSAKTFSIFAYHLM